MIFSKPVAFILLKLLKLKTALALLLFFSFMPHICHEISDIYLRRARLHHLCKDPAGLGEAQGYNDKKQMGGLKDFKC